MKRSMAGGLAIIFLCLAVVSSGMASEGVAEAAHHKVIFGKAEIFQMINFILLVIVSVFLYKKYAGGGFEKRSQQIKMAMEEAEQARLKAEEKYNEYKSRLEGLNKEIEEILVRAREEGSREHDQILEEANVQAEKIRTQAEMTAKQEVLYAKQVLREETINLAAQLALGLLNTSATQEDHTRLVDLYLKKLGELN